MKRLVFLLCFVFSLSTAYTQSELEQEVTISFQGERLEDALYLLIDQYQFHLSFRNDQLPSVTVQQSFQTQSLATILDTILQNTGIAYQEIGNQIVFFKRKTTPANREFTISGFIRDDSNGERLYGATIYDHNSGQGAVSNEYGFFSLTLPEGAVHLSTSFLGFQAWSSQFALAGDLRLQIDIVPSITLSEVIVQANAESSTNPYIDLTDGVKMNIEQTKILPSLAGEPDVLRTAMLMPGIHTGTDGAEGLHIRGGDAGQNLILMDGVPVYNVGHAIGLFSIFNTNSVRSFELHKGGFPARYGGRLSGVLDIRIKEGNLQHFQGQVSTGLIASNFSLEGPLVKNKSSFFIAARRSFVDWILRPQSEIWKRNRGGSGLTDYGFYDINAKINHTFSLKDRVYLSLYKGRDKYIDRTHRTSFLSIEQNSGDIFEYDLDHKYEEGVDWGNTVGAFRWNHIFNDKVFSNFSLTYSQLAVEAHYSQIDSLFEQVTNKQEIFLNSGIFNSGISDLGARLDFHVLPKSTIEWRFGIGTNYRKFKPGALEIDETDEGTSFVNTPVTTNEFFAYAEGRGTFGENWRWNIGVHSALWQVREKGRVYAQPRVSLSRSISPKTSLRLSGGQMVQFSHLLSNSSIGLPLELWVPSTDNIKPAKAWLGTIGMTSNWRNAWQFDMNLYYKKMNDLLAFNEGADGFRNWEENATPGVGRAYGAEWQISKTKGAFTGWVAYTLASSERQFELINLGKTYRFKFDRKHDIKLVGIYKIKPGWYLSANWVYSSGFNYTIPLIKYRVTLPGRTEGIVVEDPEGKNSNEMPAYHRFDINLRIEWMGKNKLKHAVNIGLYNAYNQNNPLYYDVRRYYDNVNNRLGLVRQTVEAPFAPLLPTFSYTISF